MNGVDRLPLRCFRKAAILVIKGYYVISVKLNAGMHRPLGRIFLS